MTTRMTPETRLDIEGPSPPRRRLLVSRHPRTLAPRRWPMAGLRPVQRRPGHEPHRLGRPGRGQAGLPGNHQV